MFCKIVWSDLLCSTKFSEIKCAVYCSYSAYCFSNYFVYSVFVIRLILFDFILPTELILAWYSICSNPLLVITFPVTEKMHENMKAPEMCNDILEFTWIIPNNFIIFLCCNDMNRCIGLCMILHTMLDSVVGQWMDGKNVWKRFYLK